MDYINRDIGKIIKTRLFAGKAILLYGPRQSGKTTLLRALTAPMSNTVIWLNGDSADVRAEFETMTLSKWNSIIGAKTMVVVDEAQRLPQLGLALKLLVDGRPDVQVIATGSSSFELAQQASEPLTGRKYEYHLLPLSYGEMCAHWGMLEEKSHLEERLLYGSYPDIVLQRQDRRELLGSLASSYLYKDILMLESVKRPALLEKLVRALALQIGSEVSLTELSRLLGVNVKTIAKYVGLLEQSFVIFSLPAFSRNARVEIRKGRKIYFYDLGIRNAILGNYTPIASRTDLGALWENYLIVERLKMHPVPSLAPRRFFWRTSEQNEVDYIEESGPKLSAYQFKWNPSSSGKFPRAFHNAYPEIKCETITSKNFETFVSELGSTPKTEN